MNIYYPQMNFSKSHVDNYFQYTPASTGDVLSAEFFGATSFGVQKLSSVGSAISRQFYDERVLTKDEYNESQYFRDGLSIPNTGVRESVARSLAEAHDRRYERDLVLSRAQRDFSTSAARFGASVVGSIFDPVNVGIAFAAPLAVGLYAPARAASARAVSGITAKYGATAGRVAAGAGEAGLAGLAFEAGVALPGSYFEQDPDYGLMDAFINVTAGSILGGTVTGVGGKLTDVFSRSTPETVVQAYRSAIAQTANGEPVRVEAVLKTDPALRTEYKREVDIKTNRLLKLADEPPLEVPGKGKDLPPTLAAAKKKPTTNLTNFIRNKGGINPKSIGVSDLADRLDTVGFRVLNNKGLDLEDMKKAAQEEGFFPSKIDTYNTEVDPDEFVNAVETDAITKQWFSDFDAEAVAWREASDLEERVAELGIDPRGLSDEELFDEINIAENAITADEAIELEVSKGPGVTEQEMNAEVARVRSINQEISGLESYTPTLEEIEFEALAYERGTATPDAEIARFNQEIESLEEQVKAMADNKMIGDDVLVELDGWTSIVERSENMDEIAFAGASCVIKG